MGKRVAVAHTDGDLRDSIGDIITSSFQDTTVVQYETGDALVAAMGRGERYDCINMGYRFARGRYGVETIRAVRSIDTDVPIVVFTAMPHVEQQVREAGANEFVKKPGTMEGTVDSMRPYLTDSTVQ